jgi:two-component system, OmpR family, sensor histidine kinase KdpD
MYLELVRIRPIPKGPVAAALGSVVAVAVATGAVFALKPVAPVLSLGTLYIFAVLEVAIVWGLPWAIGVSVASMLTFNFFFLPPLHTFTLRDSENWVALAVYLFTAVVVSELAARARRRAEDAEQQQREASLLAEVAAHLLEGRKLEDQLGWIGTRTAEILGVGAAEIELGTPGHPHEGRSPHPLAAGTTVVGTLYTDEHTESSLDVRRRFLPALASLLAVANERQQLTREAFEAEALRRSDTVKTAILRAVSHDLRSPLTAIATAVGALRNKSLSLNERDREELLETIDLEQDRLNRLVANLLEMSRLQAGAASPDVELWTVDELIRQAIDDVGADGRVRVRGADAQLVRVDGGQIERVLTNLLENALKFSPEGAPVQVRVTATRAEVIVRVVDQGPGIPERELERIFEPFYRRAGERVGAGLGLAIARGFAQANGARLWAESRPDQGATFALALPAAEEPAGLSG